MDKQKLNEQIDSYLDQNWEAMVDDIASLVAVKSVGEVYCPVPEAPFGTGPREALDRALAIAECMGLTSQQVEGRVGVADLEGQSPEQIAIVGNLDVVDTCESWNTNPFELVCKDGYLLGRGTADGKAPLVAALHVANFFKQRGEQLPNTLRVILGTDRETRMRDIECYKQQFGQPSFAIATNAQAPVACGEKGMVRIKVKSAPVQNGQIYQIDMNNAPNVIPDFVGIRMTGSVDRLNKAPGIGFARECCGSMRIESYGKTAHAAAPDSGINAVARLMAFLLENPVCSMDEQHFFELVLLGAFNPDGSGYGLACSDELGPLTITCSQFGIEGGTVLTAIFDVRYPSVLNGQQIVEQLNRGFSHIGGCAELLFDLPPYKVDAASAQVKALVDACSEVSGQAVEPQAIGQDTYARLFDNAASIGFVTPGNVSDWVGGSHGPNEGISEQAVKDGFRALVLAVASLMEA